MLDLCALQSFFCLQIEESSSNFSQIVEQFLNHQILPSPEILEECQWQEPFLSEEKVIDNWKQLLTMNLFFDLASLGPSLAASKVRLFERHPWNQSSQYLRSIVALNHALAKMPIPEAAPHLLESGAALIDFHEYHPWLSLPFTPHHFEFGIFLCLLSLLTQRDDLKETVLRLAHWQLNTLDAKARPLPGLFVREKEGKSLAHLCLSYLFFRSAAILKEGTPFSAVAEAALKGIREYIEQTKEKIDPLWPLIEKWLDQYKVLPPGPLELPENICDPSTALVGYRSPNQHIFCTLHGCQTGLGEMRLGDIHIVNYGPQYLPLGECLGFGIEGNSLTDHGMRRSIIEWRRGTFILKGCARLVDQPQASPFEAKKFRGIWLEVAQEFKKPHFNLKTTFLGLDGWEGIAFSFFIKAERCKVKSQILHPFTLERYEGEALPLIIEGQANCLEIRPLAFKNATMQVIPLAGGNNFWGAYFLAAYFMNPHQRHYQWHVGPSPLQGKYE